MARMSLFVLLAPLLFAQTKGTVEGRVVSSVTHAAISGVAVKLRNATPRNEVAFEATTDISGEFRITDVAAADYMVQFSKSGFGDRSIARKTRLIEVANGETVRLSVELVPLGILRGRVLDGEGRPVAKARIELARIRGGSANVTTTDVDGR